MKVRLLQKFEHDFDRFRETIINFRSKYLERNQFMITSVDGNEYFQGAGTESDPQKYVVCNEFFKDTTVSDVICAFPEFFRWRILCIPPKNTYSIHRDGWPKGFSNMRLHIPVRTNIDSYMIFYAYYFPVITIQSYTDMNHDTILYSEIHANGE